MFLDATEKDYHKKGKRKFAVSRSIFKDYLQFHGNRVFVWSDSYHHQLNWYFVRREHLSVGYFEKTLNFLSRSNWIYLKTFLVIFEGIFFSRKSNPSRTKIIKFKARSNILHLNIYLIWTLINHVATHYHPILQRYEPIITSCYPLPVC